MLRFAWPLFGVAGSFADADDDMLLELAFSAGCTHIVTHNVRDFRGSEEFGVAAVTPGEFLRIIS